MMRILVCGGRDYADKRRVAAVLDMLERKHGEIFIIQGGATGADRLAREWAEENEVAFSQYPAHWKTQGRAAGPIRNTLMLTHGQPDLVVAFPGGNGTANMVKQARAAGANCLVLEECQ